MEGIVPMVGLLHNPYGFKIHVYQRNYDWQISNYIFEFTGEDVKDITFPYLYRPMYQKLQRMEHYRN